MIWKQKNYSLVLKSQKSKGFEFKNMKRILSLGTVYYQTKNKLENYNQYFDVKGDWLPGAEKTREFLLSVLENKSKILSKLVTEEINHIEKFLEKSFSGELNVVKIKLEDEQYFQKSKT